MTPDVNVFVAASRSDHPHHGVALDWLMQAVVAAAQGSGLRLQPMVVASFLRLVTHPRIFVQPTPMPAALAFIETLMALPGVEQPSLGAEFSEFTGLCRDHALTANDVPDAWLAAAVMHQADHLVSFDGDFRRLLPRSRYTHLRA